jgi:hypothetical protein
VPPSEFPTVRLVDIPDAAPPYDCEAHGHACPAERDPGPAAGPARPGGRDWAAGPAYPVQPGPAGLAEPGVMPAAAGATAAWPRQFALVMVEILAGIRPARQIAGWTTERVRAHVRHLGPLLASDRQPRIQRIVTSRPADRVVEMTVIVRFGPRWRALAMRLEHVAARPAIPGLPARPARWLCTEIEAG